jgi:hypothetical protein
MMSLGLKFRALKQVFAKLLHIQDLLIPQIPDIPTECLLLNRAVKAHFWML